MDMWVGYWICMFCWLWWGRMLWRVCVTKKVFQGSFAWPIPNE